MSLSLHTIHPAPGSKKRKKRIGRGGKRGTYSGRGIKGQKARSGASGLKRLGMRQLIEQTPKLRGFKSHKPRPEIINLSDLSKKLTADLHADLGGGSTRGADFGVIKITPQILQKKGLVDKINSGVKILGDGEIKVKLEVLECKVSKSAREKIESVGGVVKE